VRECLTSQLRAARLFFALEVTWRRQAFLPPHKPLISLRNSTQSVQSIMGATEMRRDKLFIFLELKRAIGPVLTGPTLWV
jgi:primosomal protein N'